MSPIKVVGREFFGTMKGGHVYLTKKFRELLGIEDGDVLLLEIKEFKPSSEKILPHNPNKRQNDNGDTSIPSNHTSGVGPSTLDDTNEVKERKAHPTITINERNNAKLFDSPKTLEEVSTLLHRSKYECYVELDQLVRDGKLKKTGDKYFLLEGEPH